MRRADEVQLALGHDHDGVAPPFGASPKGGGGVVLHRGRLAGRWAPPEMPRGKGVRLQRYKDGGVSDAKTFALADGLTWKDGSGRTWTVGAAELKEWIANRAEAGRLPPKGFPKNNRFG